MRRKEDKEWEREEEEEEEEVKNILIYNQLYNYFILR